MIEIIFHWLGGIFSLAVLGILLYGIWRGTRQRSGRTSGANIRWLRSGFFYVISTVLFVGLSILFWRPLPLVLSGWVRLVCESLGALIFFPGMALLLWARLTLGRMYFVSTSFSAQLYAHHRLITQGPFAFIRHPMYAGLVIAGVGSLFLYLTWTTLAFAVLAPFVLLRARREEIALKAEFGDEWQEYCRRVPAFLPQAGKRRITS